MSGFFSRKPIAALLAEGENPSGLRRALGAGDLIMLAIGAVIGAGIFGAIGTAAAGETNAAGEIVRSGAGPALVLSFVLLGLACMLAGLCYAELASMIPQAGSAYAYSYATLGEIVAWIIGWDLILEYAVGNVAVAISWGDYFKRVLAAVGIHMPPWLTTGYRTAALSSDGQVNGLLQTAPYHWGDIPLLGLLLQGWARVRGFLDGLLPDGIQWITHLAPLPDTPILLNVPAFAIVALITWLLYLGVKESTRANNIMVAVKLAVLALFIVVGATRVDTANYHPFAPNGFTGIHHGAAIVFFAYIGFDAISTAAEETKNPQRNLPIGILAGLGICTLIYVIVGAVLTGMVPYTQLGVADPLAKALDLAGLTKISTILSIGAVFSMAAVLLVFQYGQPRIFFAMARDGLLPRWAAKIHPKYRTPHITTLLTGGLVALAALVGDAGETYDLTNIGTLFAFVLVCVGVLVLRVKEPERPRPFRVPFVWVIAPLGALACAFVMKGLPRHAWERFAIWLVIGILLYFAYGFRNSTLRRGSGPVPVEPPEPIEKN